jgi:RHS repeat-associated protein
LHRLTGFGRGGLNETRTAIATPKFAQCWGLDATGNWQDFRQDDGGDSLWDLVQGRASNPVNEVTLIHATVGSTWVTPVYDRTGNMTTLPKPTAPTSSYRAIYDAWNRLVKLADGATVVAEYQYDGMTRRTVKKTYIEDVISETRQVFYSEPRLWQVLEERVNASGNAERQFVWGRRYPDDLLLRDRDSNNDQTLEERLYSLQDSMFNVTAITDASGMIAERNAYTPYGTGEVLDSQFLARPNSLYGWETRYSGWHTDTDNGLFQGRQRDYHPLLGLFFSRDQAANGEEILDALHLYNYTSSNPVNFVDDSGRRRAVGPPKKTCKLAIHSWKAYDSSLFGYHYGITMTFTDPATGKTSKLWLDAYGGSGCITIKTSPTRPPRTTGSEGLFVSNPDHACCVKIFNYITRYNKACVEYRAVGSNMYGACTSNNALKCMLWQCGIIMVWKSGTGEGTYPIGYDCLICVRGARKGNRGQFCCDEWKPRPCP